MKKQGIPAVPAAAVPKSSKPSVPGGKKTIDFKGPGSSALPKLSSKPVKDSVRRAPLTHPKCK